MKNERIVYVAYCTERRKFISKSGYSDDFTKARIYNKRGHLTSSVNRDAVESGKVISVPIKMTIEEETIISLKLGATEDMLFD